ncbi:MAG: lipoprotein signal peptidase [Bacteroidetes bacterium]|jgi:signal peptidase II|nr:lipoprotein signal peptidase [Bacteroidota bacterium]
MNGKKVAFLIALIIFIDQAIKFYIKLNFFIGEEHVLMGSWARLHFIENEGMAWGLKFGGGFGKIILTLFRLAAVVWGTFLIKGFIEKKYHNGFIVCAALIYAGAVGNLIDSLFYGIIFEASVPYTTMVAHLFPMGGGYATFLHGKVVDMFYFPIIQNAHFPSWFPFWGGEEFEFFRPVFNFADASISTGVITLFIFQKTFFNDTDTEISLGDTKSSPDTDKSAN